MGKRQAEESLLEHRRRIDAQNRQRSGRAVQRGKQWKARNDMTTKKRAESDIKTDEEFVQKHTEQARRRDELQEREREYRTGKGNEKNHAIRDTQGKANTILKDKADA